MVVCKFFLQGTCKFGNMCKFEHDINESYNPYQSTGTSIMRNSTFTTTQVPAPVSHPKLVTQEKSSVDTSTLVKSVVNDMTQAEKGGQWLFSCYAPFKEKPTFPGFEDQSFEELRYGYYKSAKTGTLEQYKQQIQGMVQQVISKVRSLQNPSPDIVNLLINIFNIPPSSQASVYSGNTATNTGASNFSFKTGGISQQSTSIFAPQANQTVFGNNSIFGGQQANQQNTGSIFQNNIQPNMQYNAQTSSTNIFTSGNQQSNTYQPVSQSPNIFSSSPTIGKSPLLQTPNANIFNQAQSQFSQSQNDKLPPPHSTQMSQSSIFSQPSVFPNPVITPTNSETNFQSNIFKQTQHIPALANVEGSADQSFYSKLEDLTEDEIKWFESDDLDISKIPEKPPTYKMCFNA